MIGVNKGSYQQTSRTLLGVNGLLLGLQIVPLLFADAPLWPWLGCLE